MPKKIFTGKVIKDAMDKTVTVAVSTLIQHPLYKKTIKRTVKLKAHDANNQYKVGDKVKIVESRPYSKTKKWTVYDGGNESKGVSGNENDSQSPSVETEDSLNIDSLNIDGNVDDSKEDTKN